jgi:hypothetical protein
MSQMLGEFQSLKYGAGDSPHLSDTFLEITDAFHRTKQWQLRTIIINPSCKCSQVHFQPPNLINWISR